MWVNLNAENYGKEPQWVKTTASGTIVDRGLGFQKWSQNYSEMSIFCHYPNPELEMMMFSLLPIDSPLFDMDIEPTPRNYLLPIIEPSPVPFLSPVSQKIGPLVLSSALATLLLVFTTGVYAESRGNP